MGCQWGVLELYVECIGPVLIHIVQRHIYTNIYTSIYIGRERDMQYMCLSLTKLMLYFSVRGV